MRLSRSAVLVAVLAALAATGAAVAVWAPWRAATGQPGSSPAAGPAPGLQERQAFRLQPPAPAHDFVLTDQHGRPFQLSAQKGHPVLLFFGYTHCPDVCPTTLVTFKSVKELLGERARDVRFVFITVDPERDTPERLREHVGYYDPDFVALWGPPKEIDSVRAAYGIVATREQQEGAPGGYWIVHTAASLLVDPQGRLSALYPFGTSAEEIAADLRQLLR